MQTVTYILQSTFYVETFALLHLLIFVGVAIHLLYRPRNPLSTLLWLFITFSFPFIGWLFYMMMGINRVQSVNTRRTRRRALSDRRLDRQRNRFERQLNDTHLGFRVLSPELPPCAVSLNTVHERTPGIGPLLQGNTIHLYSSGAAAIRAIFAAIREAQDHIHIQSYIIANDKIGRELMELLCERAHAGVDVCVLYDTVGSAYSHLSGFFRRYRGIPNLEIRGFTHTNLARFTLQANIRNHRKITIVDGKVGFTGGVNFHKAYFPSPDAEPILDIHFKVEGPIVGDLQYTFLRDWYYITSESPRLLIGRNYFPPVAAVGEVMIRGINNGPTDDEIDVGANTFTTAIINAVKQILVITPYFVPTEELTRVLIIAALKGVDVRILVPRENNHPLIANASRTYYHRLLQAGVRIFERYAPFIHSKALLIDTSLAIVGSSNLDPRSLNLNYETNLVIPDAAFSAKLKRYMLGEFAHAEEINLSLWNKRPLYRSILENACNLLNPNL